MQHRRHITVLAAKHRLPAIYNVPEFMGLGGLMAYAPDLAVMTPIACKAAPSVVVARGKQVVDFGMRGAHGAEADLMAARAAYIAGVFGHRDRYSSPLPSPITPLRPPLFTVALTPLI